MLTIDNFNVEPNSQWFVRLDIVGDVIAVGLYATEAHALSGINVIALGYTTGLGSQLSVNLSQVAASPTISKFSTAIGWNLQVSGSSGDPYEVYEVGPFTDMDDVSHAIYQNGWIIPYRAAALVDARTYLDRQATIVTPKVDPSIDLNKSLHLVSTEMGADKYYSISSITYEFDPDSMKMTLVASDYERMVR